MADQAVSVQQLSSSLYRVLDACNVYLLRRGEGLTIRHRDEELKLTEGKAVLRPI